MSYYNVPSERALTQAQAYKIAVERWGVDADEARRDQDGICYQGNHGQEVCVDWEELPGSIRNYI